LEKEMDEAMAEMEGMTWPGADGSAPAGSATGDENPECKQS
jgi:hypothetical protein